MYSIYPNLCSEMDKANMTMALLAEKLNIPEKLLQDKMSGAVPWFLDEVLVVGVCLKNCDLKFLFTKTHDK